MPTRASQQYIRAERRRFRRAKQGQTWSVKDLPKFYYHRNFCEILDSIEAELSHLLDAPSKSFIDGFRRLPFYAQCAYVRLCGRKGTVFNINRFNYDEIESLSDQFDLLNRNRFTSKPRAEDHREYLSSLTKPELSSILSDQLCKTKFKKSWKKDQLIKIAMAEICFTDLKFLDGIYVQRQMDSLGFLLYLHSGQVENSLQSLTLRDLGLVTPPKSTRRYGQRFENNKSAKAAWFYARALHNFRHVREDAINDLIGTIDEWPIASGAILGDRDKLLHKLGGFLERRGDTDRAINAYERSDAHLCNERVVRLRYKAGDKSWVKARLEKLIENPSSDDEHAFAQDFYARKFNKKRTSTVTDILRSADSIQLDEAYRNEPEQAALQHYKARGLEGYRSENVPWKNLFGLMFWELLFPNREDLQMSPSLNTGQFYDLHKDIIEGKLSDLDTPHIVLIQLLKTLSANYGSPQEIVRWNSRSLDRIQALVECAPKGALAHMLRLMAQNWYNTKDGYPDLMIIENGQCRLVEVKATGDVIRRNQLTRLRQLRTAGFKTNILQVGWTIDPDQTYVVVDVETTGGRAGLHRVTEIGAVKVKGGQILSEWSSLINPQRSIPANITRITGISEDMVADAPVFAEIVDSFSAFMGDAIFAAHNVNFDYGFLSAEFRMVDRRFRHPKICTCSSMRKLYPGLASYSLKNLCREFSIDLKSHHRALCDAKAAAQLLFLVNEKRLEDQA